MIREYIFYRVADVVARCVPRRFGYWVGLRIADCYWRYSRAERLAVISNLRRILKFQGVEPSGERLTRLARRMFQHFGKYVVDFFHFSGMTERAAKRLVSIEHPEYLEGALAYGRGVLVLTAHLGGWELGGAVCAALGHPLRAVVLPQRMKRLNDLFQRRRRQRGIEPLPYGNAIRGVLKGLKANEAIALLADRDFSSRNDFVPFFGQPARLPRGPAWLCARTGAPIVPGFLLRQPDDAFLLRFCPVITKEEFGTAADIQGQIVRVLEKAIGNNPEQWYIFDDFWKEAG
ncbi:MAG: lysophospholipid acyltransferase family protein [Kiritimatiellae bacterium]|nr:lysophospholipid acyltransferase family protein [Kiritimatiellia bacterium]